MKPEHELEKTLEALQHISIAIDLMKSTDPDNQVYDILSELVDRTYFTTAKIVANTLCPAAHLCCETKPKRKKKKVAKKKPAVRKKAKNTYTFPRRLEKKK